MEKDVWVEHKELGAAPRPVPLSRFEKLLGSKGWSRCAAPERVWPERPKPEDVQEKRRKELAAVKRSTKHVTKTVEGDRRKELAEAMQARPPKVDQRELRRMELARSRVGKSRQPGLQELRRQEILEKRQAERADEQKAEIEEPEQPRPTAKPKATEKSKKGKSIPKW